MLRLLKDIILKRSAEFTVSRTIQRLVRKINYDYDYYLKLEIISELEHQRLLTSREGRGFLKSLIERDFENKAELVAQFYQVVLRRLHVLCITYLGLILTFLLLGIIEPVWFVAMFVTHYFTNRTLLGIFFKNINSGVESAFIKSLVSKIKIENALKLRISTLNKDELENILQSYPKSVREVAEVLISERCFENFSDLMRSAEKLAR